MKKARRTLTAIMVVLCFLFSAFGAFAAPALILSLDHECVVAVRSMDDNLSITLGEVVITASEIDEEGYIIISWEPVDGAEQYCVYVERPWSEDVDVQIYDTVSETSIKIPATPRYHNRYHVVAFNSNGRSEDSNAVDSYCEVYVPNASAQTDAVTGRPEITWGGTWQQVKYVVLRSDSESEDYVIVADNYNTDTFTFEEEKNEYCFIDTSAVAGKVYYYKVAAAVFSDSMEDYVMEAYSEICSASCKFVGPTAEISNVQSSGKIKLTWNAVENAEKYVVYRSTSKTGTYSKMYTTTKTSYTNTNAKPGKYYYYYVVAVDANGVVSEKSNIVGRTCDYARPAVTASNVASTGKVKLTWTAVEGATSYKVYRSTKENGTYSLMKTVKDGATTYTNTNAVAGKKYYYKVRAYGANSSATSAYSVVDARTCDLPRPVVKITTSSGKPKLSWAGITGATKYKIYRSTSKTGTYSLVKTTTSKYWKDTTAKKGKTYYYKVVAVHSNTAANSSYSAIKSIKCTK